MGFRPAIQKDNCNGYIRWAAAQADPVCDYHMYIITSLIFTHNHWGNTSYTVYLKEAQYILNNVFTKSDSGTFWNLVNQTNHLIRVAP
jgi:L-rhamnose mutarotase